MLLHFVAPTLASVLGLIVIFFSVQLTYTSYIGDPTGINLAFLAAVLISIVWVVVLGPIIALYYKKRKPEILEKAGIYDSEVAE